MEVCHRLSYESWIRLHMAVYSTSNTMAVGHGTDGIGLYPQGRSRRTGPAFRLGLRSTSEGNLSGVRNGLLHIDGSPHNGLDLSGAERSGQRMDGLRKRGRFEAAKSSSKRTEFDST